MLNVDTLKKEDALFSSRMVAVLFAQFFSALADNAVLIAAIAILKTRGLAEFIPTLQELFVIPFILLVPFVGGIADGYSKKGFVKRRGFFR